MVRATRRIRSWARAESPSRCTARVSTSRAAGSSPQALRSAPPRSRAFGRAALRLAPPGEADARGHLGGSLALPGPRQLLAGDGGDVHVQVDAVEDGAGDAAPVAEQLLVAAQAGAARVAQEAARAGVHGGDQLELGRVADGAPGPGEDHVPLLERLAERLEHVAPELGQLVEEEDAPVGERDLAGARRGEPPTSPASEMEWCGARNGRSTRSPRSRSRPATLWTVVASSASSRPSGGSRPGSLRASMVLPLPGGPKRSRLWSPAAAISSARLAPACPATSRRSGEPPGSSSCRSAPGSAQGRPRPSAQATMSPRWRTGWTGEPLHRRRLEGVSRRRHEAPRAVAQRGHGHGQDPAHRTDLAGEGELPAEVEPLERARRHEAAGGEQRHRDGQVEPGALLAEVGRGQVHRDALRGELVPEVSHRRAHPDERLLHRPSRETGEQGAREAGGGVDLDVHGDGGDAQQGGGADADEHRPRRRAGLVPRPGALRDGRGDGSASAGRTGAAPARTTSSSSGDRPRRPGRTSPPGR